MTFAQIEAFTLVRSLRETRPELIGRSISFTDERAPGGCVIRSVTFYLLAMLRDQPHLALEFRFRGDPLPEVHTVTSIAACPLRLGRLADQPLGLEAFAVLLKGLLCFLVLRHRFSRLRLSKDLLGFALGERGGSFFAHFRYFLAPISWDLGGIVQRVVEPPWALGLIGSPSTCASWMWPQAVHQKVLEARPAQS